MNTRLFQMTDRCPCNFCEPRPPNFGTLGTINAYNTAFLLQNGFIASHILWEVGIASYNDWYKRTTWESEIDSLRGNRLFYHIQRADRLWSLGWIPWFVSAGFKRLGREPYNSPPFIVWSLGVHSPSTVTASFQIPAGTQFMLPSRLNQRCIKSVFEIAKLNKIGKLLFIPHPGVERAFAPCFTSFQT
jgi:hypothetical protein